MKTFTETRTTGYAFVPYAGAPIYVTGNPPGPWDIASQPKQIFHNETLKIEIPNTAHVENCGNCTGIGTRVCHSCDGAGTQRCHHCHGSGHITHGGHHNPNFEHEDNNNHGHHNHHGHHRVKCHHCHGSGYEGCHTCHRNGRVQCCDCTGSGKLKWYLELTIIYKQHENDFVKQTTCSTVPDELIRKCQSQNIFSEQNTRIYPLNHHPDFDINNASNRLLSDHSARFINSRILAQKHDLFVIPITQCYYTWKEKQHNFQIYGLKHSVYSPDYPKKCCCTIL